MAQSKCVACGHDGFEMKEVLPSGAPFKFKFVQCAACGVVVGVTGFLNADEQFQRLKTGMSCVVDSLGGSLSWEPDH